MPDEFSEKPRILMLACENDAYPALDMAGMQKNCYSAFVRVIPVRCLGSVNTIWITDALNAGYDGVMMMGCKHGDDYQCHFVKGSELASYRMSKIDDTLKQLVARGRARDQPRGRDHRHRARAAADQRLRGQDQRNRHVPAERIRMSHGRHEHADAGQVPQQLPARSRGKSRRRRLGQDVHAVRRVRRLLHFRPRLGTHAAEDLHDDPRRQARGSAHLQFDVDVHVLLQLHRALSARAADHPHHARPGELRAPPRPRAEEPADARLLADLLGQLHQDRPRQRTQDDHQRVLQGRLRLRREEDVDPAQHRARTVLGQAPESDGAVRGPRLQGQGRPRGRGRQGAAKSKTAAQRSQRAVHSENDRTWQRKNTRSTPAAPPSCAARPPTT